MQIQLTNGKSVRVDVQRKDVKHIRLRVYPDGTVRVTAPRRIPESALRQFVDDRAYWIQGHLAAWTTGDPAGTIRLEGRPLSVCVRISQTTHVYVAGGSLHVEGPTDVARDRALDTWWRKHILAICVEYVTKWYPALAELGHHEPEISVRKMKTMWGSCTPSDAKIRFNYFLLCVPSPEIEYVVLHELAHLENPNHGPKFQTFMTEHMADWRARRATLATHASYIAQAMRYDVRKCT